MISDKHADDALRYEDSSGQVRAVRGAVTAPGPIGATPTIANVASANAVNVPAGGTGTAAGGWDTAGNRDTAITNINAAWTLVNELKAQLNSLLTELRAKGYVK